MTNIAILTTHVFPPHTPTESFLRILVTSRDDASVARGGGEGVLPYIDYTVCATGQGMVFRLSSLEQGI